MDLSIIIPVCNDVRLERCVNSIDEQVEVVAALNRPTKDVVDIVKRLDLKSCEIDKNNLGMAYNAGMNVASNDLILFMDSDCVFAPSTIKKLYDSFEQDPSLMLARGYVNFKANSSQTRLTKNSRTINTSNVPYAFIPPLMLKKSVFDKINDGYAFAEDVIWCVDYEFELRRSKAGIPLKIIPDAVIFHDPLPVKADLRSAFMYGTGCRIRHERTGEKKSFLDDIKLASERIKNNDAGVVLYLMVWDGALHLGYLAQKYLDIQNKWNNKV